jgi:hypothetical protein
MGKNNTTDTFSLKNATAFSKGCSHRCLKKCTVLGTTVYCLDFVLHYLTGLRRQQIVRIEGIMEQRIARQDTLEPDKEKIREVSIGYSIVIRWISEPDAGTFIRKR